MNDITRMIQRIESGDPAASEELLPLVYAELRRIAQRRLVGSGQQSMQATVLVHEAYLRLVDVPQPQSWDSRGHFFIAAAEAMRRILVEHARRKGRIKHGGRFNRVDLSVSKVVDHVDPVDLEALDEAMCRFEQQHPDQANLVKLRFFAGLSEVEAAQTMEISRATASRYWTFARTWLYREMSKSE